VPVPENRRAERLFGYAAIRADHPPTAIRQDSYMADALGNSEARLNRRAEKPLARKAA